MGKKAVIANGIIVNIIEYGSETGIAGLRLPAGHSLRDCSDTPVQIGDRYQDGKFLHDGAALEKRLSLEARIGTQESALAAVSAAVEQIGSALTEISEKVDSLRLRFASLLLPSGEEGSESGD